jgi:hypothetical protein
MTLNVAWLAFESNGKRASMMQKSVAWLLAFASLLIVAPSFASDGVKVAGTAEKLRLEVSNATVDNALATLRSAADFKCVCSPPLDRRITGVYQGNLRRVLSRLLEGYDYVIKTSPSGIVELIVLRTNASAQPNPGYASSPGTVVGDEARGRPSAANLSQPDPGPASSPPVVVDDERRGRAPRGPPGRTDEDRQ